MRLLRCLIASLLLVSLAACGAASESGPTITPRPPEPSPIPIDLSGRIAYVTRDRTAIRTIMPDGSDDRLLTTIVTATGQLFSSLSASPDGQFIAYAVRGASGNGTMTILRRDGSPLRIYNSTGAPVWSADGTQFVAPILETEVPTLLNVVYPSGSDETVTPLARIEGGKSAWFPDGKRLAYVRDNGIYAFDLATSSSLTLSAPLIGVQLDWQVDDIFVQPDGARIWVYAGNFESPGADGMRWWTLPAAGGELEPLLERKFDHIWTLAFAPAGRALAYVEGRLGDTCENPQADTLYLSANAAASQPEFQAAPKPAAGPHEIFGVTWEPSAGRLAFAAQPYDCIKLRRTSFPDSSIYVWPIDGSQPPARIAEGAYPTWIR
jgi:hypothetical protein